MSCCMRVSMTRNGCWSVQILCHYQSIWCHILVLLLHDEEHLFHPLKHRKTDILRKLGFNEKCIKNKLWDIDVDIHEMNKVMKAKLLLDSAQYYGSKSQIWLFLQFLTLICDICIFLTICATERKLILSGSIVFSVMSKRCTPITFQHFSSLSCHMDKIVILCVICLSLHIHKIGNSLQKTTSLQSLQKTTECSIVSSRVWWILIQFHI